jgi:hypothetical protein
MLTAKGGDVDLALSSLLAMDEFKTVAKVPKTKQQAAPPARDSRQSSDRPPRRDGTPAGRGAGRGAGSGGRGGSDRPASGRGGGAGRGAKSVPSKPVVVAKEANHHPDAFHADQNVSEIGAANGTVASGGDWGEAAPSPPPGWGKGSKTMAEIIKAKQAPPPVVAPVPPPAKSSYRRSQHADAPIDPPFEQLQQVAPTSIEPPAAAPQAYSSWNNDAAKNLLNSLTKGTQGSAPDHSLSAADTTANASTGHFAPVLGKTTAQEFEAQQLASTFGSSFGLGPGSSDPFASTTNYEAPSSAPAGTYGSYISSQAPPTQPQPQAAVNSFASSAFPASAAFGTGFGTGFSGPADVSSQSSYDAAAQAFSNFGQDQLKQQQAAYAPAIAGYNMQYQQMGASAPAASAKPAYGQSYQQNAQSSSSSAAPDAAAAASSSTQTMQQALPAGLPAPVYPSQGVSGMPPGLSGYNAYVNPYGQQFNPANPYMQYQNMYNMATYGYQVNLTNALINCIAPSDLSCVSSGCLWSSEPYQPLC